ncbi:MAG: hypothetical protein SV375_16705, partial [Thermodesulfobacteriota bacterium]|nr:hypothetical protein [Thermodesulfobacteriota bacterium]
MSYESPTIRPPSEARSLLIRATRHCSWNRCIFCYGVLWDRRKLELRPVEDIKKDILSLKDIAQKITTWAEEKGSGKSIEKIAMHNSILWLTVALPGEIAVTAVPGQHWSSRGLLDRNHTLWLGFVIEAPG